MTRANRAVSMTEAWGFGDDMADAKCMRCGCLIKIPAFLVDGLKKWNRQEDKLAQEQDRVANYISLREVAPCATCLPIVRAEKDEQAQLDNAQTAILLRDLRAGRHNAETRAWLRSHGHLQDVIRVLREEGNRE